LLKKHKTQNVVKRRGGGGIVRKKKFGPQGQTPGRTASGEAREERKRVLNVGLGKKSYAVHAFVLLRRGKKSGFGRGGVKHKVK